MPHDAAVSFCEARGAVLAPFGNQEAQEMVSLLCDQSLNMECWTAETARHPTLRVCMALKGGRLVKASCALKLAPVCITHQQASNL